MSVYFFDVFYEIKFAMKKGNGKSKTLCKREEIFCKRESKYVMNNELLYLQNM
jgi:hypothetical protein